MPKLLFARAARDAGEERQLRQLAGARHAPGDWITRARIVVSSWDGMPVPSIAQRLGCHPETVRRRMHRFNAEGIDGLGDRPGSGAASAHRGRARGSSRWSRHPAGQAGDRAVA